MPKSEPVRIPADLSSLPDQELTKLLDAVQAEFGRLDETDDDRISAEILERMAQLADAADSIRGVQGERAEETRLRAEQREGLRGRMSGQTGDGEESDEDGEVDGEVAVDAETSSTDAPREPALIASSRSRTNVKDVLKDPRERLNVRLANAREHQPSNAAPSLTERFGQTVIVASADIPNMPNQGVIGNMSDLVRAVMARARALPDSRHFSAGGDWTRVPRYPVAQMQRQFRYNLDENSRPEDAWEVMQQAANPQALVAAGGWCSPSEISYDFYNIAQTSGLVDLPTTGIRRGGMRWPTSPSFGDLSASTGLWHWNETQDIAAATGTGQSGSKTCARVPCASFNEARLEGEGVCITAGNLTTDAWPEQIANFMRLVDVAHARRVNTWFLNNLVAQSTAVSLCATGIGAIMPLLDAVEMQAIDIRTKYSMGDNAVLEAIFPSWIMGVLRADLAKRNSISNSDAFGVTNAQLATWLSMRGISAQFVEDYQVRTSGYPGYASAALTAWPTTVQFMMYPAGTFVRGNGLTLDLGVIRDSTLNATNDYTAAWSEEFFLLAKIGHESRVITVPLCPNGATGATMSFPCTSC